MIATWWNSPYWAHQLALSVLIIVGCYVLGFIIAKTLCQRLRRTAVKTTWKWDEHVVDALQQGIPLWSMLLGVYLAADLWNLSNPALLNVHRTLYVLLWLSVTLVCAGLVGQLIVLYGTQFQHDMPVTSLTQNIAKILIIILGGLMILHGLGISITPLLTALGVGGLAVALALQDTLSNMFAGFYLTVEKQVRIGDYIKLHTGEEGHVEDIGWRATKLRMLPNNIALIPNNKLAQANIVNFNLPSRDLAVTFDMGVEYGSDLSHIEQVTVDVARDVMKTVPGGVPEFEPFIRYHTFGDYRIMFTVIMRAREFVDQYLVKHEFIKRLHVRYQKEEITIPIPTQVVG